LAIVLATFLKIGNRKEQKEAERCRKEHKRTERNRMGEK
jgi:hypothetical protein